MDDTLFDTFEQSMLRGGFDYPLTNGDLDFSLPPELEQPPILESVSNTSSFIGEVGMRAVPLAYRVYRDVVDRLRDTM